MVQTLHDLLPDILAWYFGLTAAAELSFNLIYHIFQDFERDRPFLACPDQPAQYLLPAKLFSCSILFNDQQRCFLDHFKRGETALAFFTFASTSD
jgi:hypothetical protein